MEPVTITGNQLKVLRAVRGLTENGIQPAGIDIIRYSGVANPSVYRALQDLTQQKLLTGEDIPGFVQERGPYNLVARYHYTVTERGIAFLQANRDRTSFKRGEEGTLAIISAIGEIQNEYVLGKDILQKANRFFPHSNNFYVKIERMVENGLLERLPLHTQDTHAPRRTTYSLTEEGQRILAIIEEGIRNPQATAGVAIAHQRSGHNLFLVTTAAQPSI